MPQGKSATLFSRHTKAIVWGMQTRAVQGMLDFDYVCSRDEPSVAAMVYPFTGDHKQKFYWGHKEILIPVFKNMADAMKKHPEQAVENLQSKPLEEYALVGVVRRRMRCRGRRLSRRQAPEGSEKR